MNIFTILIIIFLAFLGISLILSGISLLSFNSNIEEVEAVVESKSPNENNCIVLPSGDNLCNYVVSYDSPTGPVSKSIGIEKNLNIGDKINVYINKENDKVSTINLFIPCYYPWLIIVMGILDFVFIYYFYSSNCVKKVTPNNKLSRQQIEYIFGDDDIVIL